jgi:hypothetical protein
VTSVLSVLKNLLRFRLGGSAIETALDTGAPKECRSVIMKQLCLCALALLLASCSSPKPSAAYGPDTLGGNRKIQSEVLQDLFTPDEWKDLLARPYAGFVILRGMIAEDGHVANPKIFQSYPDGSRDKMALEFGPNWKIRIPTINSRMPHLAEIYVVFYEGTKFTRKAIVFGTPLNNDVAPTRMSAPSNDQRLDKAIIYVASY